MGLVDTYMIVIWEKKIKVICKHLFLFIILFKNYSKLEKTIHVLYLFHFIILDVLMNILHVCLDYSKTNNHMQINEMKMIGIFSCKKIKGNCGPRISAQCVSHSNGERDFHFEQ